MSGRRESISFLKTSSHESLLDAVRTKAPMQARDRMTGNDILDGRAIADAAQQLDVEVDQQWVHSFRIGHNSSLQILLASVEGNCEKVPHETLQ